MEKNTNNTYLFIDSFNSKFRRKLKMSYAKFTYHVFYYLIAFVLIFAGITKSIDPSSSHEVLKVTFNLPDTYNLIIMILLPLVEITLSILMLAKFRQKIVLLVITFLFLCFLFLAVYGTVMGWNIDCGCFSSIVRSEFGVTMIFRNILLTIITIGLVIENKKFASAGQYTH